MLKIKGTEIQQALTELMMQAAGPLAQAFRPVDDMDFDDFTARARAALLQLSARRRSTPARTRSSATSSRSMTLGLMNFDLTRRAAAPRRRRSRASSSTTTTFDARAQDRRLADGLERRRCGRTMAEMGLLGLPLRRGARRLRRRRGGRDGRDGGASARRWSSSRTCHGRARRRSSSRAAGTDAQQKRILPARRRRASCTLAFAHTERGARYDLRARRHARHADAATAACSTARSAWCCTAAAPTRWSSRRAPRAATPTPTASACSWSIASAPGVTLKELPHLDELRAADIVLDGVRGRPRRAAGREGRGARR